MPAIHLDPATMAIVATVGKLFIEFVDSQPPLPPDAGYWARWAYAFMQRVASNGAKAEAARVPTTEVKP